jgi:hypothetical protein
VKLRALDEGLAQFTHEFSMSVFRLNCFRAPFVLRLAAGRACFLCRLCLCHGVTRRR